jgi:hypothetical protein
LQPKPLTQGLNQPRGFGWRSPLKLALVLQVFRHRMVVKFGQNRDRRGIIAMRRHVTSALPAALLLGLAAMPPAVLAAAQDGNWTVLIITEKGDCDPGYRYNFRIADGRVRYQGEAAVDMTGTVAPNGAVKVSIKLGEKGASGTGRLSGSSGVGTWRGVGPNSSCAGRWEAERR